MIKSVMLHCNDENEIYLLLHPLTREHRKNENAKKRKKKQGRMLSKTRTQYKIKTKTDILQELCKLDSGECCMFK